MIAYNSGLWSRLHSTELSMVLTGEGLSTMDSSTAATIRDWGALRGPEICPAGCSGCVPLSDSSVFSPRSHSDSDLDRPL